MWGAGYPYSPSCREKLSDKSLLVPNEGLRGGKRSAGILFLAGFMHKNVPLGRPLAIYQTVSELDFSHLRSKGVGYALHQFAQRKVIDAHPTGHDDTDLVSVRTTILKARLATRPSFACGSDPCTGQANRQFRPTCGGLGPTGAVPPLPSGTQPCHLVAHKGEPHPSGSSRADVHTRRSVGCGCR